MIQTRAALAQEGGSVFPRDKREATARRSCLNKKIVVRFDHDLALRIRADSDHAKRPQR
jgi:hypothetical protein